MRGLLAATPRTPGRPTFGPAVAKIARALGKPLMPWQRLVADVALEVLPDGSWAYPDVEITVPRQQGKTSLDGPVATHRILTKRAARCWVTAQTRQDARDNVIDGFAPDVRASFLSSVLTVRESQGSEGIYNRSTGSFFRVFAPGEDDMHGKPNELVVVDEGWSLSLLRGRALDQAIGPTFLSTGGQYWRHSTAGTDASVWMKENIGRARAALEAGGREGIALFEFGLPDELVDHVRAGLEEDTDSPPWLAAVQTIIDHMPAKGYTLHERVVFTEARRMDADGILRAFGNKWTRALETVIPTALWAKRRVDQLPPPSVPVALAFACDRDRARSAIVAAWREPSDPRMRWRVIDERPGTSWLAGRVAQLIDERDPIAVGYDRFGPATDVGDELLRDGYELRSIGYAEMATACIGVLAAVADERLVYAAHGALDDVAERAGKKELGDRWVWSLRGSAGSIAALVAGTIAGWYFDHTDAPAGPPTILLPSASNV